MVLRVSPGDVVHYANEAFCRYAGRPREEIEGCAVAELARMTTGEVSETFTRIVKHLQPNPLVTDSCGRVFEVKTARELGALDIVLDEVTHGEELGEILRHTSGTPFEELDEDELRTLRNPDLRFVTICRARLQTDLKTTGSLTPWDQRILTNAFIEELSESLISKGCTILPARASGVAGLSGAPRHHSDHALRALEAAFEQISRAARLQNSLFAEGREMPSIGWGLASGDAVVGTFGGFRSMSYSAEGRCLEIAERIAGLASPGEVLLTEDTLSSILQNLPQGWSSVRTSRDIDPDLSPYASHAGSIQPIEGGNLRGVWLIGPGVSEDWQKSVYIFDYLWNFQSGLMKEPVPVLRAIRIGGVAEHIPLSMNRVPDSGVVHRLGKYRLLSVIGHGGMGRVWRAQDIYGNIVAIKTLNAPQADTPESVKRFRREAEVMARLQHRNICRILEMNEHEGSHYIVMEFVDGLSLADILYSGVQSTAGMEDISSLIEAARAAKESSNTSPAQAPEAADEAAATRCETLRLPTEQALAIFVKVGAAVEFAHTHGVLHRDLKPGNILLRADGEPLVADFGLAKISGPESGSSLSMSGNVLGTVENMAPEQAASSKSVDARADVYSLGTILFQMVTGRRHFKATGTLLADIQTLQTHEPLRPRAINPSLDPDLELIILKCLRHDPAERYRGVAALLADIQRYLRGEVISARPVTALEVVRKLIQRNRAASAIAGVSLGLILLIVAGSVWSLARQLNISEKNKNLAEQRLREIEEKESLYAQTLEGRKIAELSGQELKNLIVEKEEKEKAIVLELEEKKAALALVTANAKAEKALREEAEAKARELSRKVSATASATPSPTAAAPQMASKTATPAPNPLQIEAEFDRIENGFQQDFSSGNLARFDRIPEKALDLLDQKIDETAGALLKSPQSGHGWMLMGFLRIAALEFKAAAQSFDQAMTHAQTRNWQPRRLEGYRPLFTPIHPNTYQADAVTEIAGKLKSFALENSIRRPVFGKDGPNLAAPLKSNPSPLAPAAAEAIEFFTSKPVMLKPLSTVSSPMKRDPSNNEIALQLLLENDLTIGPVVKTGSMPRVLEVTMEGNAKDLSSIATRTRSLTIHNAAQVDFRSLLNFTQIQRLDLNGSNIGATPPLPRVTMRISHIGLANTKIESLNFLKAMPNLESLDISNTPITNLSPLASCKFLRSLDASGCRLQNLQPLQSLRSLRQLTISPELIENPKELEALKSTAITSIRTPEEPADQSSADFFRKYLINKSE